MVYTSADGRRRLLSTGCGRRADAAAWMARRLVEMESGTAAPAPRRCPTLEEFSVQYLQWSRTNKRAQSAERDVCSLKRLCESFGSTPLAGIGRADIEAYKVRRLASVKPATVNRELACLRHVFTQALRWLPAGALTGHPIKGMVAQLKEPSRRVRYLSVEEERRLLAHAPAWLRDLVTVAIHTGLRIDELLALAWGDIEPGLGRLVVRAGKGGKERWVPLNATARATLGGLPRSATSGYVWTNPRTKTRYTCRGVGKVFRQVLGRAGIKDFRFHDCRHTFASRLAQAGESLQVIKELLGHATLAMVLRYAHLQPDNLARAVERLDRRQGGSQTVMGY